MLTGAGPEHEKGWVWAMENWKAHGWFMEDRSSRTLASAATGN